VASNSRLSRRDFLSLGIGSGAALLGTSVLAACGQSPAPAGAPTTAATAAPVKSASGGRLIVLAHPSFTPAGDQELADQGAAYGKSAGIEVAYQTDPNVPQKLIAAIEAKNPPDVAMFGSGAEVFQYLDHLVDLSDIFNDVSKQAGGFIEPMMVPFKVNGKFWAVPFETSAFPMHSRLDLIEKATGKRVPPATLDELEDVSKKILHEPDMYPIGFTLGLTSDAQQNLFMVIWADGGALIDKDGKPSINSPETIFALKRIKRWWDEKLIPPDSPSWDDTGNNNAYQTKRVAFALNPPSIYSWVQTNDKELTDNTALAPMPTGQSGKAYMPFDGWSWGIFKESKNIDAAKGLIRYWMQPDHLESAYEKTAGRWYPINKDLQNNKFWTDQPGYKYYPQMVANERAPYFPAEPSPPLLKSLGDQDGEFVIAAMAQDVIVKNLSPEQAAANCQAKLVEIWKRNNAPV